MAETRRRYEDETPAESGAAPADVPAVDVAAPYTVVLSAAPTGEEIDAAAAEGIDVELYRELKVKGLR